VNQTMTAAHERAAARERIIDSLHEENQRLRAGERQLVLRPILVDLSRLRNDLLRQASDLPDETTVAQFAAMLESFASSVEQTLDRGGVLVLRPEPGTPFDPSRQRAVDVLPASSPEWDGKVAEVVGDGYLDTTVDRALAPARVRVHRWAPAAD
jgi:molecular chaperone GrpE (heat shock protein)